MAAALAAAAVVWTFVAFGGVRPWTWLPAALALSAAAVACRPRILAAAPGDTRTLDAAVLAAVGWIAVQLIPLPAAARELLSPHAAVLERAVLVAVPGGPRPLTVSPDDTLRALLVAALCLMTFWIVREVSASRGVRALARSVAWSTLAVGAAAIVLRGTAPDSLYGIWDAGAGARPYGPFVNRNHMGTWLVMALPLIVGYIFARAEDRARRGGVAAAVDAPFIWLIAAAAVMFIAIVVSLSRSAFVATMGAAMFAAVLARSRRPRARVAVFGTAALMVVLLVAVPNTVDLAFRFDDSRTTATWARPQIWRETLPIVRDFLMTGTGAGTFRTAMLAYQQSDRTLFFNQAHNHYLQVAAEGGLILVALLAVAAAAFVARAARQLRDDRSPMFWIRAGAAAGVFAVGVQSLWETGLRMPANGLLFAALCGIAVHAQEERASQRGNPASTRPA